MSRKTFWVYMLYCENNSYYTGYTDNLIKRYQTHINGTGRCKYTKSFKPLYIAQRWQVRDKLLAMKMERYIKTLSRSEKEKIIKNPLALAEHPLFQSCVLISVNE